MGVHDPPGSLKGRPTLVKFCRIRRASVLREMATLGVDFAGLHLIDGISAASLSDAKQLCECAREVRIESVLLTKITSIDLVVQMMQETGAGWLQLHQLWRPEELAVLRTRLDRIPRHIRLIHLITQAAI